MVLDDGHLTVKQTFKSIYSSSGLVNVLTNLVDEGAVCKTSPKNAEHKLKKADFSESLRG